MIFLDPKHVYGGNLRALEEAESLLNTTSAAIGQRELGKKKCKEDSDCHNDKYVPCGQCIREKCKKKNRVKILQAVDRRLKTSLVEINAQNKAIARIQTVAVCARMSACMESAGLVV
jgi:hypothetical protein